MESTPRCCRHVQDGCSLLGISDAYFSTGIWRVGSGKCQIRRNLRTLLVAGQQNGCLTERSSGGSTTAPANRDSERSAVSGMACSFGQDSLPSDKRRFRLARLTHGENDCFTPSVEFDDVSRRHFCSCCDGMFFANSAISFLKSARSRSGRRADSMRIWFVLR
jgi:hypothetical protein